MARFDRMRYDYRGPEYDRRYGRYEAAYARRFAIERWELEKEHRNGRARRRGARPGDKEFLYEDRAYSRRYWPPALRRAHRMH
ncbi:MAG TPA: hypothetical protein VF188_09335 [Longimicrobiales bacterium]